MSSNPFPPGSLVAAYFRDSGGDTQELSVPQQEHAWRSWCAQNSLIPGAIFADASRPGSSVIGRTAFHDMIHHFRTGAHEAGLVIWSYSRFARDFDDAQFYRADLRRRGYIFHSLNDDIPDGPMGRLFEAAIDWKNEQFLEDLSRDIKRGLHDLVRTHGAMPGVPPRGFCRVPITIGQRRDGSDHIVHRWAPDPETIPLVRQAFAMRAARSSLSEIHNTTHLFSSCNSYQTLFTNKLFVGTLEFGSEVIENYCEPTIDPATWRAVQVIVKEFSDRMNLRRVSGVGNPRHPRRVHSRFMLSGLAFCARCGAPLFGASTKCKTKTSERYACTRSARCHDCNLPYIPKKVTEAAILDAVREHILSPDIIVANQIILQTDQAAVLARVEQQRAEINSVLAGVRRRAANITNAIAEAGHNRALLDKLAAIEAEETILLSKIAELERQISTPITILTPEQISTACSQICDQLDTNTLETNQSILRGLVARIDIDRTEHTVTGQITYYTPPKEMCLYPGSLLGRCFIDTSFTVSFTAHVRAYNKKRS